MPKSVSFPKHHNHKDIPASLRGYLSQLELALSVAEVERQKQNKLIAALESKNRELAKKVRR